MADIKTFLDIFAMTFGLIIAFISGLWAYSRYVVERGTLPPIEFTIDLRIIGSQGDQYIIEILLCIQNIGGTPLVLSDIKARPLYINREDPIEVFSNADDPRYGRVIFPHSIAKNITGQSDISPVISVIKENISSFVQSGVNQTYTLTTAIPTSATFILIKGEFTYEIPCSTVRNRVMNISKKLALSSFSLINTKEPHSAERAFSLLSIDHKDD